MKAVSIENTNGLTIADLGRIDWPSPAPTFGLVGDGEMVRIVAVDDEVLSTAVSAVDDMRFAAEVLDDNLLVSYTLIYESVGKDWTRLSGSYANVSFSATEARQVMRDIVRDAGRLMVEYMDFENSNKILPTIRDLIPPEYLVELSN